MFTTKPYDPAELPPRNVDGGHEIVELEDRLRLDTAPLAAGADAVCIFVNDRADADGARRARRARACATSRCAAPGSTTSTSRRHAGSASTWCGCPAYSPNAVAEHTIALILALNRRIHKAYNRVREATSRSTVWSASTSPARPPASSAPAASARWSPGCSGTSAARSSAYDPVEEPAVTELGMRYVDLDELWERSDVISAQLPAHRRDPSPRLRRRRSRA